MSPNMLPSRRAGFIGILMVEFTVLFIPNLESLVLVYIVVEDGRGIDYYHPGLNC